MSITKKIVHKAEATRLRTKGRADQATGNVTQSGANITDAVTH